MCYDDYTMKEATTIYKGHTLHYRGINGRNVLAITAPAGERISFEGLGSEGATLAMAHSIVDLACGNNVPLTFAMAAILRAKQNVC